ncbi:MAG: inositol monophosphatase [Lachnospiraceae bacterium]|nr:inositol monophosphatase [Lachnospiraceae bacterium]
MKIDRDKVVEVVTNITDLFSNHEKAEHIKEKGVQDYVTEVDTSVQKRVTQKLKELYPSVQMLGEEKDNTGVDRDGDLWILDPVDGTTNLIRDFRCSALSLGYVEEGELKYGVIFDPYHNELYEAEKGKGATVNSKPIHVSSADTIHDSLIAFGTNPYTKGEESDKDFEIVRKLFHECIDIRRMGAASIDLIYVATGRTEAFFERLLRPWDFAAGMLILEEAGGEVVDFNGKRPDPRYNSSILATNGRITKKMLDYLDG